MNVQHYTRADWRAAAPTRTPERYRADVIEGVAIHHGGAYWRPDSSVDRCLANVRGVQSWLMGSRGYSDHEYALLIYPSAAGWLLIDGRVDLDACVLSNGNQAANRHYSSVMVAGDYRTTAEAARDRYTGPLNEVDEPLVELLRYACQLITDRWPNAASRRTHNDVRMRFMRRGTACPGGKLAWITNSGALAPREVDHKGRPWLVLGSTSPWVPLVQRFLNHPAIVGADLPALDVSGVYDLATAERVRLWQDRLAHLFTQRPYTGPEPGEVGPETWNAVDLIGAAAGVLIGRPA